MCDFAQNPVQSIHTLSEYSGRSVNAEKVVEFTKQTLYLKEYLLERTESAAELSFFGNAIKIIFKKGKNSDPHITEKFRPTYNGKIPTNT
jgi:hypothetical protein